MSISIFFLLIFLLSIIVAIPILLIVRSSQKTRREYSQHKQNAQNTSDMTSEHNPKPTFAQDKPSIGIAIIGFLIPLVGTIMYIAWLNSLPFRARSAGKGALTGVIVYIVITAIIFGIVQDAFN